MEGEKEGTGVVSAAEAVDSFEEISGNEKDSHVECAVPSLETAMPAERERDHARDGLLGIAERYLPKPATGIILLIAASEKLQIVLLVPIVCILSLWTGVLLTWGTTCLGLAYLLLVENREHHRRFRAEYNWNCRFLAEQYHVLLSHWGHAEGPLGEALPGQIEFFNSSLASWWHSSAERTLRDTLGSKVLSALRRQLGVEHAMQQPGAPPASSSSAAVFVDDFQLGTIVAGQQPPTIVMASSSRHANRTTLDLTIRYAEDAKFTVAAVLSSYRLPITVTGIQFLGTVRLELEFATRKEEKFKLRLSLLEDLQLDFKVKVGGVGGEASSFLDIAGLPGIGPWMNRAIRAAIKEKVVWPRKMTIVGDKEGEEESTGIPPALLLPEPAICAVALVGAGENVPDGYELLDKTCTGAYAANVGSSGGGSKFLCFKKSNRGLPLTDLGVVPMSRYGDMPCGYRAMLSTAQGHDGAITAVHSHVQAQDGSGERSEAPECGDRVYLCYEKGPTTKGYIDDIQVMFSDEFPAVRKKKILSKDQPEFAFPQGYSFVKVNRIEERNRDVFLCFRRVGATTAIPAALPTFLQAQPHVHNSHSSLTSASAPVCVSHTGNASQARESVSTNVKATATAHAEEKKSSGLSSLKKKVINEYRESKNNKAVRKRQALESIGITPSLIQYLRTLCTNPDIFITFPLDDMEASFELSTKQAQHAQAILDQVPELSQLRYDLTPKHMSDEIFWYTYFSLIKNRVGKLFDQ